MCSNWHALEQSSGHVYKCPLRLFGGRETAHSRKEQDYQTQQLESWQVLLEQCRDES